MLSRTVASFLVPIFLLVASFTPIYTVVPIKDFTPTQNDELTLSSNGHILIESDSDFENQGWPGNGTVNNPYIIGNLQIEFSSDNWACIYIENVASHFTIRNCSFSSDSELVGIGITIIGSSNGQIVNCTFTELSRGISSFNSTNCIVSNCLFTYSRTGIVQESCEFDFVNNTILHCRTGLLLESANKTSVNGSTFLFNRVGADLYHTFGCNLTYNILAYNTEIGVRVGYLCSNTRLFGNKIAFNQDAWVHEDSNAQDDGHDNLWDDNVSIGNEWGDYSGTGVYEIPGTAGSVDSFPGKADFDMAGPTLYRATDLRVTVMPAPCPFQSLGLQVSVYDQSGVHTVRLYYSSSVNGSWSFVEMEPQPTTQYPDAYSYEFAGPLFSLDFIEHYYFWANDTLGQETVSEMYECWLYCSGSNNPVINALTNPVIITIISGSIAAIVLALIIRKYKIS